MGQLPGQDELKVSARDRPITASAVLPPDPDARSDDLTLPSTTMTSNYTTAPPAYQSSSPSKPAYGEDESSTPLLGGESVSGPSSGGAIYDQPGFNDIPDDFKVRR